MHVGSDPGTKHRHRRTSPGTQKRHLARIPKPTAADLSFLVFFHSSNKGCTASLDALRDLSNKLGSKLRIIIITQEDSDKIAPILTPYISERIGVALDHDKKVFGSFGVDFVPFSVLIDAKNRVLWMGNPQSMTSSFIQKIVQ